MRALILVLQAVPLVVCMSVLKADVIHVPSQQSTIQAGIDAGGTSFDYEMRFNCGGDFSFLASNGEFYLPDQPYTPENHAGYRGGHREGWIEPVGGTPNDRLYRYGRAGFIEYRFDVVPGYYVVTLRFSDNVSHGRLQRVFDILVEGETALHDLDLCAMVGKNYAVDHAFAVLVTDGQLNVTGSALTGEPLLSAISVVSWEPDTDPPVVPSASVAIGSYRRNIVWWKMNPEWDLNGYNVYRSEEAVGPFLQVNTELLPTERYIDDDVVEGEDYYYRVTAVDVWDNESEMTAAISALVLSNDDSDLPVHSLEISQEYLDSLNVDPWSDDYVPGDFYYGDDEYLDIGVRYRGNISRSLAKKSWKVKFNSTNLFEGRKRMNLKAQYLDWSLIRDRTACDLYRKTSCLCPTSEFTHLQVNDEFMGVFSEIQQVDEKLLRDQGRDEGASIYKCMSNLEVLSDTSLYPQYYEKKTNQSLGYDDLIELIELINYTPQEDFATAIWSVFDIPKYLDYYSIIIATANYDFTINNYYLVHDLTRDYWEIVPWDNDVTFGIRGRYGPYNHFDSPVDLGTYNSPGSAGGPNELLNRILEVPRFRWMHCQRLLRLLDNEFSESEIQFLLNANHETAAHDALLDIHKLGWESNSLFENSIDGLNNWVIQRRLFLYPEIYAYMPPDMFALYVNEFMADNDTTITDEFGDYDDWVEIYNPGPNTINLGGMYMTDDFTEPDKWMIPDTVIEPGEFLLFWADDEPDEGPLHMTFKLSKGGEKIGLFDSDLTPIDMVVFGSQSTDISYGRYPDGDEHWQFMEVPTPGGQNLPGPDIDITVKPEETALEQGDTLRFEATAKNNTTEPQTFQIWTGVSLPSGLLYPGNPLIGPIQVTLQPEQQVAGNAEHIIPDNAPYGTYTYGVLAGTFPDDIIDIETFDFAVLESVPQFLFINEFMADNDTTIPDEFGDYDDWVELYNSSGEVINLAGMYMTDDLTSPATWQFPDTSITAGGFLLLWADDEPEEGPLHMTLKLSKDGEEIGLYDSDLTPIDEVVFGPQTTDVSYGRLPDGGEIWVFFENPTPGWSNSDW